MNSFALWICFWPSFVAWHSSWRRWGEVQMKKKAGKWILKCILCNRLCPCFAGCCTFASWGELCSNHVRGKDKGWIYHYVLLLIFSLSTVRCRAAPVHGLGLLPPAQQTQSSAAQRQVTGQHPTNFSPNTLFHSLSCLAPSLFFAFLFIYFPSVTDFQSSGCFKCHISGRCKKLCMSEF